MRHMWCHSSMSQIVPLTIRSYTQAVLASHCITVHDTVVHSPLLMTAALFVCERTQKNTIQDTFSSQRPQKWSSLYTAHPDFYIFSHPYPWNTYQAQKSNLKFQLLTPSLFLGLRVFGNMIYKYFYFQSVISQFWQEHETHYLIAHLKENSLRESFIYYFLSGQHCRFIYVF